MKIILSTLLLLVSFVIMSCSGSGPDEATQAKAQADQEQRIEDPYLGRTVIDHKEELVFIYITSPGCGYCSSPTVANTVINLKNELSKKADSLNIGYLTMGIAVAWDGENGYEHLSKFGKLDEILIGNNWFGTGGLKYLFEEIPGRPGVPQVLLTHRIYDATEAEDGSISNLGGVVSEKELIRYIGSNRLEEWLEEGVRIPDL